MASLPAASPMLRHSDGGVSSNLPLLDWIKGRLLVDGKVSAADMELFLLTDDVEEAVQFIVDADAALAENGTR